MISRIRVIGLVGAGAICSAGICSLFLAFTLSNPAGESLPFEAAATDARTDGNDDSSDPAPEALRDEQAFLVAFLADADPQVRTLAAWGLMTGEEADLRKSDVLEFVGKERDPEVRAALYRSLQGQRSLRCSTLVELLKQEDDHQTWLAGCDLLAGVVQSGASDHTEDFFNLTIVPELKQSAVNGTDLHGRIAAIIALRRAGTQEAVEALEEIIHTSRDAQVVQAASSAIRLAVAGN